MFGDVRQNCALMCVTRQRGCVFVCAYPLVLLTNVNTRLCLCIFCYAAYLQVTLLACGAADASQQWKVTEERILLPRVARLAWFCEAWSSPVTESLFLRRWACNQTHILHTPFMLLDSGLTRAVNHLMHRNKGVKMRLFVIWLWQIFGT